MTSVPRWLAAAVWAPTVTLLAVLGFVGVSGPPPEQDAWAIPLYGALVATWSLTGAFLATRRPDNRVGLVMWSAGVGTGLALVGQLWTGRMLASSEGELPATELGTILGLLFEPSLFLVFLVPQLFPDGRFMSRRWAAVGVLLVSSAGATLLGALIRPGAVEAMPGVESPLAIPALADLAELLSALGGLGALACIPAGIAATIVRYRRAARPERAQLKWFGSVLVLALSMFLLAAMLPQPYGQWAWIVASLSLGLVPVAIAMAILRYRLFEIDRIISRTLGYGIVTAVLFALFWSVNLGLQGVLSATTRSDPLVVAASTLLILALFQPVRRRVQAVVDRRFNRARYDAERTVERFSGRLRDELDLSALAQELHRTTSAAVQPTSAAVWLRTRSGAR